MKYFASVAVAAAICANCALADTLHCTLADALSLSDGGQLEPHPLKDILLKDQAVVETETGKVFHPEFGTSFYDFIEVLDHGSKVSSFKVIAYSSEGAAPEEGVASFRNAAYFEVKTYAEGPAKPFLAVTNGYVAYGLCE